MPGTSTPLTYSSRCWASAPRPEMGRPRERWQTCWPSAVMWRVCVSGLTPDTGLPQDHSPPCWPSRVNGRLCANGPTPEICTPPDCWTTALSLVGSDLGYGCEVSPAVCATTCLRRHVVFEVKGRAGQRRCSFHMDTKCHDQLPTRGSMRRWERAS